MTARSCAAEGCVKTLHHSTLGDWCRQHKPRKARTCVADGCGKTLSPNARGDYCRTHLHLSQPECAAEECTNRLNLNSIRKYCNDHLHLVKCEAPDCGDPVTWYRQRARLQVNRYCIVHLHRVRAYGSFDAPERDPWPSLDDPADWLAWLRRRVEVDEHGCWLWAKDSVNPTTGYINLGLPKGHPSNGHRMAVWADTYVKTGKPPQMTGYQVDHQCHMLSSAPAPRRHCVNPDHLALRKGTENRAEAVYRKARDTQVRELVAALREVAPDHEILKRYAEWQC